MIVFVHTFKFCIKSNVNLIKNDNKHYHFQYCLLKKNAYKVYLYIFNELHQSLLTYLIVIKCYVAVLHGKNNILTLTFSEVAIQHNNNNTYAYGTKYSRKCCS